MVSSQMPKNTLKQGAGNALKNILLKNLLEEKEDQIQKIFESLNLLKFELAEALITEYQHLFALNLSELGKTSLVQHDIKLDDVTPFKEQYRRIPPHQNEEVNKHLQEMLDIGAIQ